MDDLEKQELRNNIKQDIKEEIANSGIPKAISDIAAINSVLAKAISDIVDQNDGIKNAINQLPGQIVAVVDTAAKESKDDEIMPGFIQALYGVVIGINSLQFIKSIKELSFYTWLPDTNKVPNPENGSISGAELLFKFVFFSFTILIVAHDWYTYHKSDKYRDRSQGPHKFWSYAPQLGSLFFMGQMLNAAAVNEMIAWYFWGFMYTLCNVWHSSQLIESEKKKLRTSYVFHFMICLVFGGLLFCFKESFDRLWIFQSLFLLLTLGIVIGIWFWREVDEKKEKKEEEKKQEKKQNLLINLLGIGLKITAALIIPAIIGLSIWKWRPIQPEILYTAKDIKKSIDSAATEVKQKINYAVLTLHEQTCLTEQKLLVEFTEVDSAIAKLLNRRPPGFPRHLADSNFINRKLGKLDSLLLKQQSLIASQKDYLSDRFAHFNNRFDTTRNDVKELIAENNRLAGLLQTSYTGDVTVVLDRIKANLEKLKKRLQKKSAISKTDIDYLQGKIDSIRVFLKRGKINE